jgi:diguanylate cyclase (GGDEF)-like protein
MIDKRNRNELLTEIAALRRQVNMLEKTVGDFERMENDLRRLTYTDELTGLYNRRGFFTLAEQQLKMASRFKGGILILYADIDNLKSINDTYGHDEGSRAIKEVANILRTTYRDSDIIARIGGDEFVVFPVGTSEDSIKRIIERLQANIDQYNKENPSGFKLSVSFGISKCGPKSYLDLEQLLKTADSAMYRHKNAKKLAAAG